MMIIEKSPLELLDFNILNTKLSFEHPEEQEEINVENMVSNYQLDFDFMIKTSGDNLYAIFTKIMVNEGEIKVPGHSIFAEGVSVFRINTLALKNLKADDIKSLIYFSAVTIAFSNIRGFISDMTSYTPSGKYIFPVFDLQSLIKKKQDKILALKARKIKSKAKPSTKPVSKKVKKI